ncbi:MULTISPECIES: hypothetical protein [Kitasatospora]|uniref:Uncharacterized protein n=1 Tax=Kitasatospora setae (strain ATCC 33774 / DSM 43861 / JCM 3304 / KCC A-0304 / NBRC 14216 / KM-6054) TaxID=452652 RepID=E4NJ90_KITSK|nr:MULTISPECIES: hypothetical protein [Kitasatospora]BAJ33038.1 hypothetical protein KSE_72830 [Kitasatospora setae KM-6054]
MTRRELFRRYAAEHFTAPDVSAAGRSGCRGTVERQTSRARLASLARIAPKHPVPAPVPVPARPAGEVVGLRASGQRRWAVAGSGKTVPLIPAQRSSAGRPASSAER